MKSFIHILTSPACITRFDGQIIDANTWFQKSFKASTQANILKSNLLDLVVDKEKYRLFTEYLLAGNIIQNEKLVVKNLDGKLDVKITYASVLSFEKQQIVIQIFESFLNNHPTIDRAESILSDIPRLAPHLNKGGKELLSEIVNTYENILKGNELSSKLAHIKHMLSDTFPFLAKAEIDISALLVEGFSTVEIAIYCGYSASKVRNYVYRICKKLEVKSLEELLKAFQPINNPGRFYPEAGNLSNEKIKGYP